MPRRSSRPYIFLKMNIKEELTSRLQALGLDAYHGLWVGLESSVGLGELIQVQSPIDGQTVAELPGCSESQVSDAIEAATEAFQAWRSVPPPRRGEFVRQFGDRLRHHKNDLAFIVSAECGKIYQEALGEVQEMIDICDFAVGLSRQLYGLSIASERPAHRLAEQWHPLGPVGCISAFNFPVAVWAWNAAIAWVCGDPVVWKPSEKTPLCSLACQAIAGAVIRDFNEAPEGISILVVGDQQVGRQVAQSNSLPLISATGSVPMGRSVAGVVGSRLGRALLELGGNNAAIVTESADLKLALRGVLFSAVGTCGQRCTSLRRLILHDSVADGFLEQLKTAYRGLSIGNPLLPETLVGPLIDEAAFEKMQQSLQMAIEQGGTVFGGERLRSDEVAEAGVYVRPAIVEIGPDSQVLQNEVFAPVLYVNRYRDFDDAIAIQNNVPQGLSSAVFTSDLRQAEWFCSPVGSDCGIANVNIGTSGAEIGGAFGGEKETGGGRESGSDAWKSYMRRATNTINYSADLPLAQGIQFG